MEILIRWISEKNAPLHEKVVGRLIVRLLIDELLASNSEDYSIHFYELSKKQVLSTICFKA